MPSSTRAKRERSLLYFLLLDLRRAGDEPMTGDMPIEGDLTASEPPREGVRASSDEHIVPTVQGAVRTSQVPASLPLSLLVDLLGPLLWIFQGGNQRSNSREIWDQHSTHEYSNRCAPRGFNSHPSKFSARFDLSLSYSDALTAKMGMRPSTRSDFVVAKSLAASSLRISCAAVRPSMMGILPLALSSPQARLPTGCPSEQRRCLDHSLRNLQPLGR